MAVDRFGLPLDDDEQIQQMTNVFTIPTSFEKCMTIEEQLLYLELTKQDRLVAGENVTLTRNDDHTVTISVNSVGKTYRIAEVTPDEGYVAAYALVEVETGVISGSKIQIPEPGTGVTPVITATASVDSSTGTPSVQVVKTGTDEAPNFAFNFHNLKGQAGQNGENGSDGAPGYSPSANIQQTATGAIVTITDEFGTTQAEITNGSDGAPGQAGADGVSPTANVAAITGGARITITDANGTTTQDIMDGSDGSDGDDGVGISSIAFKETDASGNNVYTITLTNNNTYTFTAPRGAQGLQGIQGVQGNPGQSGSPGADGVSPVANVQSITGGARITITDANGTTTADVMDGAPGQNGQNGAPGYSPTASIQQTANGATITITDENGTTTATITNGQNGSNGVGISDITFKETDANGNNVYTVTLTDSSTYDITCPKGSQGPAGPSTGAVVDTSFSMGGNENDEAIGVVNVTPTGTSYNVFPVGTYVRWGANTYYYGILNKAIIDNVQNYDTSNKSVTLALRFKRSDTNKLLSVRLPIPNLSGGTAGQVLEKQDGQNYHFDWVTKNFVPSGGNTGEVLTKNADGYGWATPSGGGDTVYSFPSAFRIDNIGGSFNDSAISFGGDEYLRNLRFSYQGSLVTSTHFPPTYWSMRTSANKTTANFTFTLPISSLTDFPSITNLDSNYIAKGTCMIQSNNKICGIGQYKIYKSFDELKVQFSNILPVYNSSYAIPSGNFFLLFA